MIPEVSWLDNICLVVLILGALNLGAIGFYGINAILYISDPLLQKIVYGFIIFSGVKAMFFWQKCLACSRE